MPQETPEVMTAIINDILTITYNIKIICMTSAITWFISVETWLLCQGFRHCAPNSFRIVWKFWFSQQYWWRFQCSRVDDVVIGKWLRTFRRSQVHSKG